MDKNLLVGIVVPLVILVISFSMTWMLYKRFSKNDE